MATDNFNRANETPLASPWTSDSIWGGVNLLSNTIGNSSAADHSSHRTDSTEEYSKLTCTTAGGTDGGPTIHNNGSRSCYYPTSWDGSNQYLYRVDSGSYTEIDYDAGTGFGATDTIEIFRDGSDIVVEIAGVERCRATDTTHTGGYDGVQCYDATVRFDDWDNGAGGGGGSTYTESIDESIAANEGSFRSIWRGRVQGEGVASVTDGNGFFREHYTHMYEAMDVADAVGKLTVRGRVASDNAAINDQITQWFRRVRGTDEAVVVTDAPQWFKRVVRLVNDGATIIDQLVSSVTSGGGTVYPIIVTDTLVTVDELLRMVMVSRLAGDTATISDGSVISYERIRATTDAVSVIDALVSLLITGQITYKDVAETVGVSDQMLTLFQRAREVIDAIQITDDTVIVRWSVKHLTEELGVSEDIAKALYTAYLVAVRVRLGHDPFPVSVGGYNPVRLGGYTLQ